MGRRIDLTGQLFGGLEAVECKERRDGRTFWTCLCKHCNQLTTVGYANLKRNPDSCGCLNKLRPYEWLYNQLRYNATKRNIDVTLTFEDFLEFTKIEDCYYCGSSVVWNEYTSRSRHASNLDRQDNSVGYIKKNCVACCQRCNLMKHKHSPSEFINHCRKIVEYQNGRN